MVKRGCWAALSFGVMQCGGFLKDLFAFCSLGELRQLVIGGLLAFDQRDNRLRLRDSYLFSSS